ncbi:MAG: tetratricopeptide repeat protein [Burkholderiaceae bacterium]
MIERAISLHKERKLEEASEIYQEILKHSPRHFDALHFCGLLYAQVQQWDRALELLARAVKENDQSPSLLNNLGIVFKELKKFDEAISSFEKAVVLNPNYAEAYNNLGIVSQEQGKLHEALIRYERAIALKSDYVEAHGNLGNVLGQLKSYEEAILSCDRAIEIKNDYAQAYFNKGIALSGLDRCEEAHLNYSRAISLNGNYVEAYFNRAILFQETSELEAAVLDYKKAIVLRADYSQAHFNLGCVLILQNKLNEALVYFGKVIEIDKTHAEAHLNCGNIFKEFKLFSKALSSYSKAIELKQDYAEAYGNRGSIHHEEGEFEKAIKDYKKALSMNPMLTKITFSLSSLGVGPTPNVMPTQPLIELFDNYANKFDDHLIGLLGYQAPQILMNQLKRYQNYKIKQMLDLGCGTGLCGESFGSHAQVITGVDISKKMLEQAKAKGIYSKLICADIVDFLNNTTEQYDLVVSADVFIYMGELEQIFKDIASKLKINGLFSFTIENSQSPTFELKTTQRYGHSLPYILQLASLNGFSVLEIKDVQLRREKDVFISGAAILMQHAGISQVLKLKDFKKYAGPFNCSN